MSIKKFFQKLCSHGQRKRLRQFKPIFKKYFSDMFLSQQNVSDLLSLIKKVSILPKYETYHNLILQNAYLAKVSRGLIQKNPDGKIRVVFLFQEASYWSSIKSLYINLKNDNRFEVFVVAIPVLSVPDLDRLELKPQNIQFLKDNNIDYIDARCAGGTMFDIYSLKPDYVFVQIHFDRQRVLEYKTSVMRLYTKVCLIPHAFLLSASDNKELIYQQDYYRIYVPNEYHAKQLSSVIHRRDNIEVTGYPRFDLYGVHLPDSSIWKINKKKNSNIKRIIWSPHWWAYGHSQTLADKVLGLWGYFYNYALTHEDIELIVKPHPNLVNGLVQSGYISKSRANIMLNEMNALPNAQVYMGGDYIDLFQTADLIINNSISFLAEWLPSGKPMIFFQTERKFELNEMAEQILDVYYHASSITELNEQISNILYKQQDPMKQKRITCCKKLNLKVGNAADIIKASLINHVQDIY